VPVGRYRYSKWRWRIAARVLDALGALLIRPWRRLRAVPRVEKPRRILLVQLDHLSDAVLTSPLLRARQTAEGIATAVGLEPEPDERLAPGASADDVRAVVAGRGDTVVVVGHQPDCGLIAAAIEGGDAPAFPAGGIRELQL